MSSKKKASPKLSSEAPATSPNSIVALGVITSPHGLRGELRVRPYNPASSLLCEVDELLVGRDGDFRSVSVLGVGEGPKFLRLRLEGLTDRDTAETYRGLEVALRRRDLPETEEDEYYFVDLVGLRVIDEADTWVGTVDEVIAYPSVSCLRVRRCDNTELEIPFADPWVVDVDANARIVRVRQLAELEEH